LTISAPAAAGGWRKMLNANIRMPQIILMVNNSYPKNSKFIVQGSINLEILG
jgi:hypothetical protein